MTATPLKRQHVWTGTLKATELARENLWKYGFPIHNLVCRRVKKTDLWKLTAEFYKMADYSTFWTALTRWVEHIEKTETPEQLAVRDRIITGRRPLPD